MRTNSLLRIVAALALTACVVPGSYGQGANKESKSSEEAKARQERIENGIVPLELGGGQAPLKLSLAELMKAYNVPALSVAVIDGYRIAWAKAYGTRMIERNAV